MCNCKRPQSRESRSFMCKKCDLLLLSLSSKYSTWPGGLFCSPVRDSVRFLLGSQHVDGRSPCCERVSASQGDWRVWGTRFPLLASAETVNTAVWGGGAGSSLMHRNRMSLVRFPQCATRTHLSRAFISPKSPLQDSTLPLIQFLALSEPQAKSYPNTYCIVSYCIVLYCIVLCCIVLYCILCEYVFQCSLANLPLSRLSWSIGKMSTTGKSCPRATGAWGVVAFSFTVAIWPYDQICLLLWTSCLRIRENVKGSLIELSTLVLLGLYVCFRPK